MSSGSGRRARCTSSRRPRADLTDHTVLRTEAYADSANLRARASIYDFKVPQSDFTWWCLDQVDWPDDSVVVDVGCGPGIYLGALRPRGESLRRVGVDLSDGMAREAAATGAATAVGDAERLPFAGGCADRALAMHMLYHCGDIDTAVSELRRVLKPGGVLVAVTNGARHLAAYRSLMQDAIGADHWVPISNRFALENGGEVLAGHFAGVECRRHEAELVVPVAEPVIRYAQSARALAEPCLAPGVTWEQAMDRFEAAVRRLIDREGAFRTPVEAGLFLCR